MSQDLDHVGFYCIEKEIQHSYYNENCDIDLCMICGTVCLSVECFLSGIRGSSIGRELILLLNCLVLLFTLLCLPDT